MASDVEAASALTGSGDIARTRAATGAAAAPPPALPPETVASWWSLVSFEWVSPLIRLGNQRPLEAHDLWALAPSDTCAHVGARMLRQWDDEQRRQTSQPSLTRAMLRTYGVAFALAGVVKLAHDVLLLLSPVVLRAIVSLLDATPSPAVAADPSSSAASNAGALAGGFHEGEKLIDMPLRLAHHVASSLPQLESLPPVVTTGMLLAVLLVLCNVSQAAFEHAYFHRLFRLSCHVRAGLVSLIYGQALRMSTASQNKASVGGIVNLQSNDAEKLANLCIYAHIIWSGPFQIMGSLGLLFVVLGVVPALTGLGVMLLLMPFNGLLLRQLSAVRKRLMARTDARVKATTEALQGIRAVKLYAWERLFQHRIDGLRDAELKEVLTSVVLECSGAFVYFLTPMLVSVASLAAYVWGGQPLTAAVAFPALALFQVLRFPLLLIPDQINNFAQAAVAVQRVRDFLLLPQLVPVPHDPAAPLGAISIKAGSFSWDPSSLSSSSSSSSSSSAAASTGASSGISSSHGSVSSGSNGSSTPASGGDLTSPLLKKGAGEGEEEGRAQAEAFCLEGIDLEVQPGQLVMVVGQVGSGKSSLLAAMLGEMPCTSGSISFNGSLAYTAQEPWIQNATLKDNVLMGAPLDAARYKRAVAACALQQDIDIFLAGDMTEIGEKGINLSGGQKHRVALARAVYADADVYLMDDPLSAVDVHVGRYLFDECVCRVLKGKTRVLVTHQLQYAAAADVVVVMRRGRIARLLRPSARGDLGAGGLTLRLLMEELALTQSTADGDSANATGEASAVDSRKGTTVASFQAPSVSTSTSDGCRSSSASSAAVSVAAVKEASGHGSAIPNADDAAAAATEMAAEVAAAAAVSEQDTLVQETDAGAAVAAATEPVAAAAAAAGALTQEETRTRGRVNSQVFWLYLKAWGSSSGGGSGNHGRRKKRGRGSSFVLPLALLVMATAGQTVKVLSDTWLAVWTTRAKESSASTTAASAFYLGIYAALTLGTGLLTWAHSLVLSYGALRAARALHARLLRRMLRLPMAFFDSQPSGRLLNRFTRDIEQIDVELPETLMWFLQCVFQVTFSLGIVVIVTPPFLIPLVPLLMLYLHIQRFYVTASRELRRLDAIARSPILAHSSETLHGLTTVRAFRKSDAFRRRTATLVDASTRATLAATSANRWLGLRLETIGACAVFATASFCCVAAAAAAVAGASAAGSFPLVGVQWGPLVAPGHASGGRSMMALELEHPSMMASFEGVFVVLWRAGAAAVAAVVAAVGGIATIGLGSSSSYGGSSMSAGFAGLALTSAMSITGIMSWLVRMTSEAETQMNSVERVLEYAQLKPEGKVDGSSGEAGNDDDGDADEEEEEEEEEADGEEGSAADGAVVSTLVTGAADGMPVLVKRSRPPQGWPSKGMIEAHDIVVRYRPELPPVIHGLSFRIEGGEKVGICGRTGSGKTTLTMALYRIVELSSGTMSIDSIDLSSLSLYALRSRLALVPQDPVVFSGSIRSNLDPFNEAASDADLWEALRHAGMEAMVAALPGGLDADVVDGGSSLSGGQRQLLCMARALVRRARVLVLDEATSNVDAVTDALIQAAVKGGGGRSKGGAGRDSQGTASAAAAAASEGAFADCTVLTIAHRLHTIIDCDRVMLLELGRMAEFASPKALLSDRGSKFSSFVDHTLPEQADALRRTAGVL